MWTQLCPIFGSEHNKYYWFYLDDLDPGQCCCWVFFLYISVSITPWLFQRMPIRSRPLLMAM